MGGSPTTLDPVIIPLIEGPEILDVGCGFGKWGVLSTTNCWETHAFVARTQLKVVGCDAHFPNARMALATGCYHSAVQLIVPPLPFTDNSFDSVLLIEVVEHLEQGKVIALINEAKRVARRRVIISTPNYPALRPPHSTITGWNVFEAHLSYVSRKDLRGEGFKLAGSGWRSGARWWREGLRRLSLLGWYDCCVRPCLSSLSIFLPMAAENVVGVWQKQCQ